VARDIEQYEMTDKRGELPFSRIPKYVRKSDQWRALSAAQLKVLTELLTYFIPGDRGPIFSRSHAALARDVGMDRQQVTRAIKALTTDHARHLLEQLKRGHYIAGAHGKASEYRLLTQDELTYSVRDSQCVQTDAKRSVSMHQFTNKENQTKSVLNASIQPFSMHPNRQHEGVKTDALKEVKNKTNSEEGVTFDDLKKLYDD